MTAADGGDGPAAARYAQLVYTSYDDGGGRGGWQVKDEEGGLGPAVRASLVANVVTRFDLEPALPEFPTPEQIAYRPARLSRLVLDDGVAALWHTVDAGRDASGRPGNVFAHVLVDRRRWEPAPFRPIELWRSSFWLRPYGVAEVAAATLVRGATPVPNPALSVDAVVAFLLDGPTDRQGVFRVLLDAVAAALDGGPGVVLGTDDHDRAASWIAAVSHFLSPGLAQRLSWTTHDSPETVAVDIARGVHLIAVRRDRLPERDRFDGVVVDELEEPYLGDPGGRHEVARGRIPVTPWSVLAEGVLVDEAIARRVLARQDVLAAALGDDVASPSWPIAAAVVEEAALAEFHPDAWRVIAFDAPPSADRLPWAAELVERALDEAGLTTSDLAERLLDAVARGRDGTRLARRFLQSFHARVAGLWDEWRDSDRPLAAVADGLRLAELIVRLAELDAASVAAVELSAFFREAGPWALFEADVAVSQPVLRWFVRPVFAELPIVDLRALPAGTALWLYRDGSRISYPPVEQGSGELHLFPFAALSMLAGGSRLSPATRETLVVDAVGFAVESDRLADPECRELVVDLVRQAPIDAAALLRWAARPDRVPAEVLGARVFARELDRRVVQAVLGAPPETSIAADVRAAAWLRDAGARRVIDDREQLLRQTAVFAEPSVRPRIATVPDDLVAMLVVGFVAGEVVRASWADPRGPFAAALRACLPRVRPALRPLLEEAERGDVLDVRALAGRSLLRSMNGRRLETGLLDDGSQDAWEDRLIADTLARDRYRGPTTQTGLRDAAWPWVHRSFAAGEAEDFFARYRRAAQEWLRARGLAEPEPEPGLLNLFRPREERR